MERLYRVEHETCYVHADRATTSQHVACLRPRQLERQRVLWHELVVTPEPDTVDQRVDVFGNPVHYFEILSPYQELRVMSRSEVGVRSRETPVDPEASLPWDRFREMERLRRERDEAVSAFDAFYCPVGR